MDRLETEDIEFYHRIRAGFQNLAAKHPSRIILLDAREEVGALASRIAEETVTRWRDLP